MMKLSVAGTLVLLAGLSTTACAAAPTGMAPTRIEDARIDR